MRQRTAGRGSSGRYRALGIVAVGVGLFTVTSVFSQPVGEGWGPVAERVRELESRLARLELRLIAAERLLEQREAPVAVKPFPASVDLGYDVCDPPYVVDANGVRLLKQGCERQAAASPCDPLYVIDGAGTRRRRPGCEEPPARAGTCDPPYTVDANGARTVRRECLDVGY